MGSSMDTKVCWLETFHIFCCVLLPIGISLLLIWLGKDGFEESSGGYSSLISNW